MKNNAKKLQFNAKKGLTSPNKYANMKALREAGHSPFQGDEDMTQGTREATMKVIEKINEALDDVMNIPEDERITDFYYVRTSMLNQLYNIRHELNNALEYGEVLREGGYRKV